MIYLVVALRLLHIICAFAWFGLGMVTLIFISPAVNAAGDSGLRFMKTLYKNTSYGIAFGILAGVTTLAGILLYLVGGATSHFSTTGNIVLGIGAVAGLLAAGHGGTALASASAKYGKALAGSIPDEQPITADARTTLTALGARVISHANISFVLMVIALIGMGSARYI